MGQQDEISIEATQLAQQIDYDVTTALREDLGSGDVSADLIDPQRAAKATLITRQNCVLAGSAWFTACFRRLDSGVRIEWRAHDGQQARPGETLCLLTGNARALLSAERAALNFLQTLSATATITRSYVDAINGTGAVVMDTRKTLPGLRLAQKYAVTVGGGVNHRFGLYDAILIKENHIAAAGGIAEALSAAVPRTVPIQIEVESLAQLELALRHGAKLILLDNFTTEALREAVKLTAGRAKLEASGGITLENIRAIAETGVDRISVGAITKNVVAIDLSLRFEM